MDWRTWRQGHPATRTLDADGGSTGFAVDDLHIVVEVGIDAVAIPVKGVRRVGVVNLEVGTVPVAIVADDQPGGWWVVYSR